MLNRMIPKRRKSKRNDDSDLWNHVKQNDTKTITLTNRNCVNFWNHVKQNYTKTNLMKEHI